MQRFGKILLRWIDSPCPAMFLICYIVINFYSSTAFYFRTPQYRLELLIAAIIAGVLLRFRWRYLWHLVAVLTAVSGAFFFLRTTQGNILFTDDHPSFFYRLTQLKENFPFIPFYNPMWNAGVEAREFFPSGVLNIYLLFYPLVEFFPVEQIYNSIVIVVLFCVAPFSFWYAARSLGLPVLSRGVAAVLSMTFSLYWYRWSLAYGTMGFVLSMVLLPLVASLSIRILDRETSASKREITLWAGSATLTALWSLSIVAILPLFFLFCLRWRKIISNSFLFGTVLLISLINGFWIILFIQASNVFKFIGSDTDAIAAAARKAVNNSLQDILRFVSENMQAANPLLVVLFISSVVHCLRTPSLRWYGVILLWILTVSFAGPFILPHLELERFMLTALMLSALPVALLCYEATEVSSKKFSFQIVAALIFGFIIIGPRWLERVTTNQTVEQFTVRDNIVDELVGAIKAHGGSGRVLFTGFILHELSGGHVASLPYYTGHALVASSYQHDKWQYTDIMPEEYRNAKDEGVERFLDINNISSIITLNKVWRIWFEARPEKYEVQWHAGRFKLFTRKNFVSNYFLSGQGALLGQTGNSVNVRVDSEEAVLKFKFLWFLKSSSCSISGVPVDQNFTFIKLSNCVPGSSVSIRAISPIARLFN